MARGDHHECTFEGDPDCLPMSMDIRRDEDHHNTKLTRNAGVGMQNVAGQNLTHRRLEKLGRYLVIDEIGRGGMGIVYLAYDPQLERRVALKVIQIRSRFDSASQQGLLRQRAILLREARALAHVSHPNVVAIYDVGIHDEGIYLAMEYIQGETLRSWLRHSEPTRREILKVMLEAGRGLAAAHHAGLVHRDFKPENVMIDEAGRVFVMDFGLAKSKEESDSSEVGLAKHNVVKTNSARVETVIQTQVPSAHTRSGFSGTPAYCAPEQISNAACDVRTDQFSFCVVLFEALCGQRPFVGDNLERRFSAIEAGFLWSDVTTARLPRWLKNLLEHGLRFEPTQRFTSMDELLVTLDEQLLARERRGFRSMLATAAVAALAGTWLSIAPERSHELCGDPVNSLGQAWGAIERETAKNAFASLPTHASEKLWSNIDATLSEYRNRWLDMHRETCDHAHANPHDNDAGPVLDLQMHCLNLRRTALQVMSRELAHPSAELLERIDDVLARMPSIADCGDLNLLRDDIPPPLDPTQRIQFNVLRADLIERSLLTSLGRIADPKQTFQTIAREAQAIANPALAAQAYIALAAYYADIDPPSGVEPVQHALNLAIAADARVPAAHAALIAVWVSGIAPQDREALSELIPRAQAMVAAAGQAPHQLSLIYQFLAFSAKMRSKHHEALEAMKKSLHYAEQSTAMRGYFVAWRTSHLADFYSEAGHRELASHYAQRGLSLMEAYFGREHFTHFFSLARLARIEFERGKTASALAIQDRVVNGLIRFVGQQSVMTRTALIQAARMEQLLGHHQLAQHRLEAALGQTAENLRNDQVQLWMYSLLIDTLQRRGQLAASSRLLERISHEHPNYAPIDHLEQVHATNRLALAFAELGRIDEAWQQLELARAETQRINGDFTHVSASLLLTQGRLHLLKGQLQAAHQVLLRALSLVPEPQTLDQRSLVAALHLALANVLRKLGEFAQAEKVSARAIAQASSIFGTESHLLVPFLYEHGQALLALDQASAALVELQRAAELFDSEEVNANRRADLDFALAKAYWLQGNIQNATAFAVQARDAYRAWEIDSQPQITAVEAWLAGTR